MKKKNRLSCAAMMWRVIRIAVLGSILSASAGGCSAESSQPGDSKKRDQQEDQAEVLRFPDVVPLRATTDSKIAVENLDSQIESARRVFTLSGDSAGSRSRLFELLSLRVQFLGQFSDLSELEVLSRSESDLDSVKLLRIRFLLMIHEFEQADEQIRALEESGTDVQELSFTLDVARGEDIDDWLRVWEAEAQNSPSFRTLSKLATVQASAGLFEEADRSFARAAESYNDVAPFPLAWLSFQRGLMWSESAGEARVGEVHYREALGYLPEYVVANVHLAELNLEAGEMELARILIERAARSEDPEAWGKMGNFPARSGADQPQIWIERARNGYERLLDSYPLAFSDHASEFYRQTGKNVDLAKDLAQRNLENRVTPRSVLLWWAAVDASGEEKGLCSALSEHMSFDTRHPVLREQRAEFLSGCL